MTYRVPTAGLVGPDNGFRSQFDPRQPNTVLDYDGEYIFRIDCGFCTLQGDRPVLKLGLELLDPDVIGSCVRVGLPIGPKPGDSPKYYASLFKSFLRSTGRNDADLEPIAREGSIPIDQVCELVRPPYDRGFVSLAQQESPSGYIYYHAKFICPNEYEYVRRQNTLRRLPTGRILGHQPTTTPTAAPTTTTKPDAAAEVDWDALAEKAALDI